LTPGQLFTDEDFCSIAMSEFLSLHAGEEWKDIKNFHCPPEFVAAFEKRKDLTPVEHTTSGSEKSIQARGGNSPPVPIHSRFRVGTEGEFTESL
jgi:hypothetical protein